MSRIKRLSVDEATAAAQTVNVIPQMAHLSVFQVLLNHPKLAGAVWGLLEALLFGSKLSPRLRELVIMRLGWVTKSDYEWTQHWRVSQGVGVPEADVLGVRDWRNYAGYDDADRAVLAATDDTLETGTISPGTWAECEKHVGGTEELLELVLAISNWRMFSALLRSLEIPLEDGVASWPPDGTPPA